MKITAVVSWLVIIVIALGIPILHAVHDQKATTQPIEPGQTIDMQFTLMGKYLFGLARTNAAAKSNAVTQLDGAAKEPLQQVAAAIIVGDLEGKDAAIARLTGIDHPSARAVRALYESQTPLDVDTAKQLDWFGKLAQTQGQPDSSPARAAVIESSMISLIMLFSIFVLLIVVGLVGFGLLITAIVLLALGKIRFRTTAPTGPSWVYVEAFALYLSSYLLGSILISLFFEDSGMLLHIVPLVIGVVLAVIWPGIRGVAFSTQRADWGMHTGRNIFVEIFFGIVGYLAGLPVMAVMFVIAILLVKLSGTTPNHPITGEIAEHPLAMLLIAAVFAPITEELLFRGAFVSHLRGSVGIVLSACISGFIFAAIHPQGWTLIPALMGIGIVLALIRQWRDSLVASMTAHALHNACLVTVMIIATKT